MKKITAVILIFALLSGFGVTASADLMPDPTYVDTRTVKVINEDGAKDVVDPAKILPYGDSYSYSSYYKDDNGKIIVVITGWEYIYEYPDAPADPATQGEPASQSEPGRKIVTIEYNIRIEDLTGPGVEYIKTTESGFGFIYGLKQLFEYLKWYFFTLPATNISRWLLYLKRTHSIYK
jgi:hypothetical protein